MLFVMGSLLFLFFCVLGLGKLALRPIKDVDIDVFGAFWFGLCVVVAVGGILQLFYPLNDAVFYVFVLLGIVGFFIGAQCREFEINRSFILTAVFLLVLASFFCSRPGWGDGSLASDTDLYHFSVVNWINEFPTVKGLANLHARLGYGTASSFFTFSALVDNSIWDGRSAWIIAPFFLLITILQMVHGLLFGSLRLKAYSVVCLTYLLYELMWLRPTLAFDSPVFCVLMVAGAKFVEMTENETDVPSLLGKNYFGYLLIPALIAFAFTIKPMAAVALASCFVVCALITLKVLMFRRAEILKAVLVGLIPIIIVFGYMSRNAVTSGWVFFPAPIGKIDAQWTMSEETVNTEYLVIKNWAKSPGEGFMERGSRGFGEWFPAWIKGTFSGSDFVPAYVAVLLVIFGFYLPLFVSVGTFLFIMARKNFRRDYIISSLTMFCSLLFWFYTAPDIRFGRGIVWLLLALTITEMKIELRKYAPRILALLLIAFLFPASYRIYSRWDKHTYSFFMIGTVSPRTVEKVVLKNGQFPELAVYVPISGDEPGTSPLPDTPYPNDNLCLIVPGDMSKGFYLSNEQ